MQNATSFHGDAFLFGVRILFEAADRAILDAACSLYAKHGTTCPTGEAAVRVKLAWHDGTSEFPEKNRNDSFDAQMHIMRDGAVIHADGAAGAGRCLLPRDLQDAGKIADLIHTVVCFLVAHAGRIPLHASAVMLGETAIILAGKSGSGKSSLALKANQMGLSVLSDDTVYVQTEPQLRIWAAPAAIHVFDKDAPDDGDHVMRLRGGRWKRAIAIRTPRHFADCGMLFVLSRGARAGVQVLDTEEAVAALTGAPEPGYEFYGPRSATAVRAVAASGCYRLTLSDDPIKGLGALLDRFGSTAPVQKRIRA